MGLTYREAGVDVDAGNELVTRISAACKSTYRPETLQGVGGFAALTEIPAGYNRPVLASATDGIGTKLKLAHDFGSHGGIGQDLVAMCANDVLVTGAEPFLFLDYYATGQARRGNRRTGHSGRRQRLPGGGMRPCRGRDRGDARASTPTATTTWPDSASAWSSATGIVDGGRVAAGDRLLGLTADGPHSNGFSLIRAVLALQRDAGPSAEMRRRLLAPTRIYVKSVLKPARPQVDVRGMAHITGGGLVENVPRHRARTGKLAALVRLDAWQRPSVFDWLQQEGQHRRAGNAADVQLRHRFRALRGRRTRPSEADFGLLNGSGESVVEIGEIVYRSVPARAPANSCLPRGPPYTLKAS